MRLVICLDPQALLNEDCAMLYPEWGDSLLVFSGSALSEAQRQRCANALRAAQGAGKSVELWQLVQVSQANTEADAPMQQPVGLSDAAFWGAVLSRLWADRAVRQKNLYWTHHDLPHAAENQAAGWQADGLPPDAWHLVTTFAQPAPNNPRLLAQHYLLPVALRALLDAPALLAQAHPNARNFRTLRLHASGPRLQDDVNAWRTGLQAATDRLQALHDEIRQRTCEVLLIDTEVASLVSANLRFEGLPSALPIRWLQRIPADDLAIRQWFTDACAKTEAVWTAYLKQLHTEYEVGGRALARRPPTQRAEHWVSASLLSKAPFTADQLTAESLLSAVQTASQSVTADVPTQAADDTQQRLANWRKEHEAALRQVARARPTVWMLYGGLVLAWLVGVVSLLPGVPGMATSPGSPYPWPWLLRVAGGAGLSLLLLAWGGAWVLRRRAHKRLRRTKARLESIFQALRLQAEQRHAAALAALRAVALGRNEVLLAQAVAAQRTELAQLAYHQRELSEHRQRHQNLLPLVPNAAADAAPPVQLAATVAHNPVYESKRAAGQPLPSLYLGDEAAPDPSADTRRALERLAGIERVYFQNFWP